jgi:UDP-glucose:(heptosyl)LPS alpha-1,3-glucosyltransferase
MKIAFAVHHITKRGGISRYVAELAERFTAEHEIHLITSRVDYEIKDAIIHRYGMLWKPVSLEVASAAIRNSMTAKKLKEDGIDITHSQGAESFFQDIITSHSCHKAAVVQLTKARGWWYGFLKRFEPRTNMVLAIERHNYVGRHYKKIITVAKGVKRELIKYYGVPAEDIAAIPNGVDLDEFNPQNRKKYGSEVRSRHGIRPDDVVLLFCGYEYARKGLMPLIESLPLLREDVKALVVGEDNKRPYLNKATSLGVGDRIVFAGRQSEMNKYYGAADVFVFPTAYEAFSLATLEAAASGLPLVTTRVNGTEELVEDGVNGFFVERNSGEIADKIKMVLDSGVEKMGAKARKTAESYSWDVVAEKTMEVYREVAES